MRKQTGADRREGRRAGEVLLSFRQEVFSSLKGPIQPQPGEKKKAACKINYSDRNVASAGLSKSVLETGMCSDHESLFPLHRGGKFNIANWQSNIAAKKSRVWAIRVLLRQQSLKR